MDFHQPIKKIANFYADKLHDKTIPKLLDKQTLESESEAKHILEFCEKMFDLAMSFEKQEEMVLGEPAIVYDVEQVYSVFNDFVSEQGYDHLIEDLLQNGSPPL